MTASLQQAIGHAFRLLIPLVAATLGACQSSTTYTEVKVAVTLDESLKAVVQRADQLVMRAPTISFESVATSLEPSQEYSVVFNHQSGALRPLYLEVELVRNGVTLVEKAAYVSFVDGQSASATVELEASCMNVSCDRCGGEDTAFTCRDSACYEVLSPQDERFGMVLPNDPTLRCSACNRQEEIPINECEALETVFASLGGKDWKRKEGWEDGEQPCRWAGVTCGGTEGQDELRHVQSLILEKNDLRGELPDVFDSFTKMTAINVGGNPEIRGAIPDTIANHSKLTTFTAYRTMIEGTIPDGFTSSSTLAYLNLSETLISGSLDKLMQNPNLEGVYLAGSPINARIFSDLARNSKLREFHCRDCGLSGQLPSFANARGLTSIRLSQNHLTGRVPRALPAHESLTTLQLGLNRLEGLLPHEIVSPTYLGGEYDGLRLNGNLCFNAPSRSVADDLDALAPGWSDGCE